MARPIEGIPQPLDPSCLEYIRCLPCLHIGHLVTLSGVRRVHVWDTSITAEGVERLRATRPALEVEDGRDLLVDALEIEPELVLGTPGEHTPVNTLCPVTGEPIDPAILVLTGGDVVGFCCTKCPACFWEDSEAYPIEP